MIRCNVTIVVDFDRFVIDAEEEEEERNMAYAAMKPTKPGLEEPQEQIHKIRITLSSKNVKNLEKGLPLSLWTNFLFFYFWLDY